MSIELKIKSKHLSLEPAIIRHEEYKLLRQIRFHNAQQSHKDAEKLVSKWYSLSRHRKWDVRNEARATHLARAYLAGKDYKSVEHKVEDPRLLKTQIIKRVVSMVMKYGPIRYDKRFSSVTQKWEYNPDDVINVTKAIEQWIGLE
jgi:hypothetical protein